MLPVACQTITYQGSVSRACIEAKQVGYSGVEIPALQCFDNNGGAMAWLVNAGIELAALYLGGSYIDEEDHPFEDARIAEACSFLSDANGSVLVLGGGRRRPEGNAPADYCLLASRLEGFGRVARTHGVVLCYHPHAGTMVEFPPEIDEILDRTDPALVGLAFDTAHVALGGDPVGVLERHVGRVRHVHLKDLDLTENFALLGRGVIDLEGVYRVLRGSGYQGWLVSELDRYSGSPREAVEHNLRFIQDLVSKFD